MKQSERIFMASVLLAIATLTLIDIFSDYALGTANWHLAVEAIVAVISIIGMFFLIRDSFGLRNKLEQQVQVGQKLIEEANIWRAQSKKLLEGLSVSIEEQLAKWSLTTSEKEVAFLLLKGLSIKEISEIRNTAEKTTRAQTSSIYSKSGLSGRTELAAFFLEDLLLPITK